VVDRVRLVIDLTEVREADRAWRASHDRERAAGRRRLRAIKKAHKAGASYAQIANVLDVQRAYVQKVCREG